MAITADEVRKVAKLARISLTDEQVTKFAGQLEKILGYIEILNEVDTSKVPETAQVTGLTNVTRPDVVAGLVERDALLATSPLPITDHQVTVPSVFDES